MSSTKLAVRTNSQLSSLQRERIIVEAMMAADRLGEGNLLQYLIVLYDESDENFGRATAAFYRDNVGDGEAFSGADYDGINWGRVVGDLFTFFLPDLLWEEERLELDAEIRDDIADRIQGLTTGYKYH